MGHRRILSPLRSGSRAELPAELAAEQLAHFGIDAGTPFGTALAKLAERLYEAHDDLDGLWQAALHDAAAIPAPDRVARFNAQKFVAFQLAKLLDNLQNPTRKSYQALGYSASTSAAKGPYPVFDNVSAIFSANPVIARTATYIYACAAWIEDAFRGKELLLEIYSRLLNPTSVALANQIVDLEAGPHAADYFAWNFNSGMAAIDGVLSHVLGRDDVLICSRNIYGGAHQLLFDWFGKPGNLDIAIEQFDGFGVAEFAAAFDAAKTKHAARFAAGRKAYLYLESPCNPHGYVLDIPGLCQAAHARGLRVILDATVATPFLSRPLQQTDPEARPDFVVHSYTKDLSGGGSVIAGVVIGRNADMFVPKGAPGWEQTLFWNVYYVKGAFLNADAAFEVLQGLHTLEVRMLSKCINTLILAKWLDQHPAVQVHCNGLPSSPNYELCQRLQFLGLPAPLFTVDFEQAGVTSQGFQRFFDNLSPTFGHMISRGQSNTIVACPALTTHSELSPAALAEAGIMPTTIRFAMGDEDPLDLIEHFRAAAELAIDRLAPGFSAAFPSVAAAKELVREVYLDVHGRYIASRTA